MNREIAPSTIAPPAANYAHAVLSEGASRLLHTAGVVPIGVDGQVPPSIDEQAEVVWANIAAILDEAGMSLDDVVSVTTYVVVELLGALERGDGGTRPGARRPPGGQHVGHRPRTRPSGVEGRDRGGGRVVMVAAATTGT